MRLTQRETVVQLPGNPAATKQKAREWVCPECDYFEDDEAGV
jgi:molybdopterin biosynthesis enzyme MoaB